MTSLGPGGFGTPTNEDTRPWLWFTTITGCSYSVLALAARFMAKWDVLGIEDVLIVCSYAFAVICWGLFDRALWNGMGSSRNGDLGEASKLFWSSWVILLCAVYVGKISVLWFERRIFSGSSKRIPLVLWSGIVLTAISGVISIIVSSASCSFSGFFRSTPHACSNLEGRLNTVLAFEIITELFIALMPLYVMSKSTMSVENKVTVAVLFGFRLICIASMAAATTSLIEFDKGEEPGPPSRNISTAAIWTQVVLAWSISSASIPCVKSFLAAFEATEAMHPMGSVTNASRGSRSNQGGASKSTRSPLQSLTQNSNSGNRNTEGDTASVHSDWSQRIMIERRVDIDVDMGSRPATSAAGQGPQKRRNVQTPTPADW